MPTSMLAAPSNRGHRGAHEMTFNPSRGPRPAAGHGRVGDGVSACTIHGDPERSAHLPHALVAQPSQAIDKYGD